MRQNSRILGDGPSTWEDLRTTELDYLRDEVGMPRYHARGFMRFMEEASYVGPTAGEPIPRIGKKRWGEAYGRAPSAGFEPQ